jgi:CubicO group peptidase (beta-lactamase class C family)
MLPAKGLIARPHVKDTVVYAYSTTKAMTGLPACLIGDCCELDFDAPVAKYRPSQRQAAHQGQPPDKPSAGFSGLGGSALLSNNPGHLAGAERWRQRLVVLEDRSPATD